MGIPDPETNPSFILMLESMPFLASYKIAQGLQK
jgi:hypothetical protein